MAVAITTEIWFIDDTRTVVDLNTAISGGFATKRILRARGVLNTNNSTATVGDLSLTLFANQGDVVSGARVAAAAAEKSTQALPAPVVDTGSGGSGGSAGGPVTAANITDASTVGRSVLTASDAGTARIALGAGTSNVVVGTGPTNAKAGNYAPTAADISDSTAAGRAVITAASQAAARTAIGAGISNLAVGTGAGDAKAGNYAPTTDDLTDATATGRSVLKAADAAAARTAIGAGTSNVTIGTGASNAKAGDYQPTWTQVTSKPTFAPVATSGAYTDLTAQPTIPSQASIDAKYTKPVGGIPAADLDTTQATGLAFGQYELQPMWVTGHSWQAVNTNATTNSRWFERVARRIGITGTITNKAQSGRTIQDIAVATLSGTNGWNPRTKALVGVACTINDVTIYDGSAAARRGYQWAWRALLSQLTANAAVAATTTSFAYSPNWTAVTISVSTAQAANTNSTGGKWFRTTTVGSYFDVNVTGDAADIFLVARSAGAGLCTFTVDGTTVATLNLTQPSAQDTMAVAQIRGLGAGNHTIRGTLTSGASLTVDSVRIPISDPVPIIVLGEPNVIPTQADHATYLADVETLKGDLATIAGTFPSARYIDLNGTGWNTATMLTEDGKHPNDAGCAYIASRVLPVLGAIPYSRGLNLLGTTGIPAYSSPPGPAIPSGGQDGTGQTAVTTPGQVTGLALSPGDSSLNASWTAATNNPTDYIIQYRTTTGPGSWVTFADGTSTSTNTTITGLTNGTSYDVQVAAANSAGTGAYSTAVTATPAIPTNTTISDDFNRSNAALTGSTTSVGAKTWTTSGSAVIGIVSNQVKVTSGTGNSVSWVETNNTAADVTFTLRAVSGAIATQISGLALRYIDDSNYITVQIRSDSNNNNGPAQRYAVIERVAGTPTLIAKAETAVPTVADIVKAEVRGTNVRVLVNGVEVISTATVTNTAGTKFGIYGNGSDTVSTWDDWTFVSA